MARTTPSLRKFRNNQGWSIFRKSGHRFSAENATNQKSRALFDSLEAEKCSSVARLYALEAIVILVTFRVGLSLYPGRAWIGFGFGVLAFLAVLPLVRLGRLVPSWRHEPWVRWTPLPEWARV
jgi:hypothetical protein